MQLIALLLGWYSILPEDALFEVPKSWWSAPSFRTADRHPTGTGLAAS
jgi:hypothetical protein